VLILQATDNQRWLWSWRDLFLTLQMQLFQSVTFAQFPCVTSM